MKKIVAIILLIAQLPHVTGYSMFVEYFIRQYQEEVVQLLDEGNYNQEQLIEFKIPLNLPYASNWSQYERYDGEIEIGGVSYNYVMRKVLDDTLHLFCLPDHEKTALYKLRNEFASKISDTESSSPGKKMPDSSAKKNIMGAEYCWVPDQSNQVPHIIVPLHAVFIPALLIFSFISPPGKPPQA